VVLDIAQAASILGVPEGTIERWIRQGKIPVRERKGSFVFRYTDLEKWAKAHKINLKTKQQGDLSPVELPSINLLESIKQGGVFFNVPGDDIGSVLREAIGRCPLPQSIDPKELLEKLLLREQLMSTGIGKGVALPHPRHPIKDISTFPMITTCFLKHKIDFKAVDNKPVFLLFLMLSPDTRSHLHLLSRLSFILRDDSLINYLRECSSKQFFLLKIQEIENSVLDKG
jgi:PTS system nitrogen regulatory IIA component